MNSYSQGLRSFPGRRMLALLVCGFLLGTTALARAPYSSIVVFGDSLSDTGRMVALTNGAFPAPPDYAWGRQSNGPVWHEYLAVSLGLSDAVINYAVIGAMTAPAPGYPTGNVWSDTFPGLEGTDVTSQVLDYPRRSTFCREDRMTFRGWRIRGSSCSIWRSCSARCSRAAPATSWS